MPAPRLLAPRLATRRWAPTCRSNVLPLSSHCARPAPSRSQQRNKSTGSPDGSTSSADTSSSLGGRGSAKTKTPPVDSKQVFAAGQAQSSAPMGSGQRMDPMTGEVIGMDDIDASALQIIESDSPKDLPPSSSLVFGHTFTDHMLVIPWNSESGWSPPVIKQYGNLSLDPSSTVFHYGPCLFEGMKAYKDSQGRVRIFRPDKNMERMNRSASRLAFPNFTGDTLIELIKRLVSLDRRWVPAEKGHSLYIRPTMIGTQAALGVGACADILLFVICSPVGPYYKTGFKPVSLLATNNYVRAWPGGTGGYKLGSNYASGVVPQAQAAALGYQQILWLFGDDDQVTEVGTMNLFMAFDKGNGVTELVTPPLDDIILPGVTRDSILALARAHADPETSFKISSLPDKLEVSERKVTMAEIKSAASEGKLLEIFGSGTAAIVSPVERIGSFVPSLVTCTLADSVRCRYNGQSINVPVGADGLGDIARSMLTEVVGRQTGEIPSDWSVVVD
ncbi:hypothetical protein E5Q_01863 [Mixia osmundae IAM 14324]|uniref:Branched-chain-amino-acid aminotransferase n=1 Tax=Mixia osmundae (strain CBS 9802 / IAM 14324 / JCM 22182 / KY 12970) TaxID=764103 RepID=G7DX97_MIXOS|nr:hypothetical protein E5Q_01863 [Mixia osmundae IAM 14324]